MVTECYLLSVYRDAKQTGEESPVPFTDAVGGLMHAIHVISGWQRSLDRGPRFPASGDNHATMNSRTPWSVLAPLVHRGGIDAS